MAVWKHLGCENAFTNGESIPVRCPNNVIKQCPNPTAGFELRCPDANPRVWRCTACSWLVESNNPPLICPASPDLECQNPTSPGFLKLCD